MIQSSSSRHRPHNMRFVGVMLLVFWPLFSSHLAFSQPSTQLRNSAKTEIKPSAKSDAKAEAKVELKVDTKLDEKADSKSKPAAAGTRVVSLDLRQLGAWSALKLRGYDASKVLAFTVRSDEMVVGAKLSLAYDYSPALIEDLSHLNVFVNDKLISTEGLPKGKGLAVRKELALDTSGFQNYNELRFNFVGLTPGKCGPGINASVWLTVNENTKLELTLAPKAIAPDLKNLPAPFYDKWDNQPVRLPFVFAASPSLGTLQAAGVLASWFGIQAGTRGAQFPTYLNSLPPENAVVFLNGGAEVAGYKGVAGSVISVQPHPANPNARLLLVNGGTDAELLRAARTIALLNKTLSGSSVSVLSEVEPSPRKPHDAPAWVRTDRAMKFGELTKLEELRVKGFHPETIRVNYRVPPDVFTWRTKGPTVQLRYRATRLPDHRNSNLRLSLNDNFVDAVSLYDLRDENTNQLTPKTQPKAVQDASFFLPPYAVTMRDQMQLHYTFDVTKPEGECPEHAPDNLVASIDAESTLDFSSFPKFAALPNLAYFTQLGFPFTRLADLSETSVVIPDRASVEEIGLYLAVMGRMGESTGYPSTRHSVISAAEVSKTPDKDFIIIGTAQSQRLFADWANKLPMLVENGVRRLREPDVSWRPMYRWEQQDIDESLKPKANVNISGPGTLVSMMGFESPLKPTRSVVFLYADKAADFKKITDVLTDPERFSSIQGDFAVLQDKSASHAKVSETYYLGQLPWHSKLRWFLADHPILVALMALGLAILAAAALYRPLKFLAGKLKKKA
jgi:cellulose synthase operon protein B